MQGVEDDSEMGTDSDFINQYEPKYYTIEFPQELRLIFDRTISTIAYYEKIFEREGGKKWRGTQEYYEFENAIAQTMHLKNSISLDFHATTKEDKYRLECQVCGEKYWDFIPRYDELIPIGQLLLGEDSDAKMHLHVLVNQWVSEVSIVLGYIKEYEESKERVKFKDWKEKFPEVEQLLKKHDQFKKYLKLEKDLDYFLKIEQQFKDFLDKKPEKKKELQESKKRKPKPKPEKKKPKKDKEEDEKIVEIHNFVDLDDTNIDENEEIKKEIEEKIEKQPKQRRKSTKKSTKKKIKIDKPPIPRGRRSKKEEDK